MLLFLGGTLGFSVLIYAVLALLGDMGVFLAGFSARARFSRRCSVSPCG